MVSISTFFCIISFYWSWCSDWLAILPHGQDCPGPFRKSRSNFYIWEPSTVTNDWGEALALDSVTEEMFSNMHSILNRKIFGITCFMYWVSQSLMPRLKIRSLPHVTAWSHVSPLIFIIRSILKRAIADHSWRGLGSKKSWRSESSRVAIAGYACKDRMEYGHIDWIPTAAMAGWVWTMIIYQVGDLLSPIQGFFMVFP